jgi:hypothetical protein
MGTVSAEIPVGPKWCEIRQIVFGWTTQSSANGGAGDGIVAQNQGPADQQDPVYQRWESIGKVASWKPENHAGSFGPWPEEYE